MTRPYPIRLTLRGTRFTDPRLPSGVLPELARVEELLYVFGAAEWRRANPGRSRLPKGFRERFRLAVTGVDAGSTVPVLVYDSEGPAQAELGFDEAIEQRAAAALIGAMDAVNHDREFPDPAVTSSEVFRLLASLGSSLQSGETLSLHTGVADGVRWDGESRRKSVALMHQETVTLQRRLLGRVSGVVENPPEVKLVLRDGQFVTVPMASAPDASWSSAYAERWRSVASVTARVTMDASGRIQRCLETMEATLESGVEDSTFETMQIRIRELAAMSDGWYNGAGKAASAQQWVWASELACAVAASLASGHPAIFLAPEGNPRLEVVWREQWDVSMEIEPDGGGYAHALRKGADEEQELTWCRDADLPADDQIVHWLDALPGVD